MRITVLLLSLLFANIGFSQNLKGFDEMCNGYIEGTVPQATPQQLKFEMSRNKDLVILDAREIKEYNTSHIKGAKFIGYNNFNMATVNEIKKDDKIYVYCSIGYRSEKIGEKLMAAGFDKVFNVIGGIFSWANSGYPVEDAKGKSTSKVHGYDKEWSKWLNKKKCTPVLK